MLQERGTGLEFFGSGRGCMEEKEVLIERNVVMVYCVVLQRWSGRQGWRRRYQGGLSSLILASPRGFSWPSARGRSQEREMQAWVYITSLSNGRDTAAREGGGVAGQSPLRQVSRWMNQESWGGSEQ